MEAFLQTRLTGAVLNKICGCVVASFASALRNNTAKFQLFYPDQATKDPSYSKAQTLRTHSQRVLHTLYCSLPRPQRNSGPG